ncbi:VTT domain-containing protein [Actinomycetaceae bacterium TAE3-ERU4]|nr:VTT domain-containing protein [Actinomycetaceae bacterium TAE3-ERU4]
MQAPTALTGVQGTNFLGDILYYFRHVDEMLIALGPWVLAITCLIVFIESGVLFPFLPGDSLIFTAGLLHYQLGLNLWVLMFAIFASAFLGDQVGYFLGYRFGRGLFKDDARILKTEHLHAAEDFFAKYGGLALVLARFVPIVRTYVPLSAGIAGFHYPRFLRWDILGAATWGLGLTFLGSRLGGIPFIRNNIAMLAMVIVLISLLPIFIKGYSAWRKSRANAAVVAE